MTRDRLAELGRIRKLRRFVTWQSAGELCPPA
jgi:hypothetical protein